MDLPGWLENIISALSAGGATYIFTRRKQTAEAQSNELENVQKAIAIWRQSAQDLKAEFDSLQKEYDQLQEIVRKLHEERDELKKQIGALKVENEQLRKQLNGE